MRWSYSDWYVMEAWRKDLGIGDEVTMLPDGNCDFTKGMGMLVKKRNLGFGYRSWRYAMIVRNAAIDTICVENINDTGDPFAVSGAPEILSHLKQTASAE